MIITRLLCVLLPIYLFAGSSLVSYKVTYSGGSLGNVKGGNTMNLYLDGKRVILVHSKDDPFVIQAKTITEVSYGQEVHRRVGTAVGLAFVSFGIGALTALSKSKKHYIGVVWADGDEKGGLVVQADKNEYRGILAGLEGITGKKAIDSDAHPAP